MLFSTMVLIMVFIFGTHYDLIVLPIEGEDDVLDDLLVICYYDFCVCTLMLITMLFYAARVNHFTRVNIY